jgi:dUTP pyrophosphatase
VRDAVRIKRLPHAEGLPLPARQTSGAAGYDICSAEDVELDPGERKAVATGLVFELPDGMEAQVRPRSGLALKHGITLPNAPGTIDPDYRGEVKVILHNGGDSAFRIARGDRIGQVVFARFDVPEIREASDLAESVRGEGGFGSTG